MSYRQRLVMLRLVDSVIVLCAVLTAFLLRFDFTSPARHLQALPLMIGTNPVGS